MFDAMVVDCRVFAHLHVAMANRKAFILPFAYIDFDHHRPCHMRGMLANVT